VLDSVSTRVTLKIWPLLLEPDPLAEPLELPEFADPEFAEPEFAEPELPDPEFPDAEFPDALFPDMDPLEPDVPLLLAPWLPLFEPAAPDVPPMFDPLVEAELLPESVPRTRTRCPSCVAMSCDPLSCLRCWPLSGTR